METQRMSKFKTKDMVQAAVLTALVFVATYFINIRLPIIASGGLVHLGTAMLFISAIVFGKEKGSIAGALGMGLFDLSSGWVLWAPFTFVIRGIMAYIVGFIAYSRGKNGESFFINLLAVLISALWMIAGYYVTEIILYGNYLAPLASIPGNITQNIVGLLIGLPVAKVFKKYKKYI